MVIKNIQQKKKKIHVRKSDFFNLDLNTNLFFNDFLPLRSYTK